MELLTELAARSITRLLKGWAPVDTLRPCWSMTSTLIRVRSILVACPAYSLANDSTYYGLEDDIFTKPLQFSHGKIAVPTGPGLGFDGDAEKLRKYAVDC